MGLTNQAYSVPASTSCVPLPAGYESECHCGGTAFATMVDRRDDRKGLLLAQRCKQQGPAGTVIQRIRRWPRAAGVVFTQLYQFLRSLEHTGGKSTQRAKQPEYTASRERAEASSKGIADFLLPATSLKKSRLRRCWPCWRRYPHSATLCKFRTLPTGFSARCSIVICGRFSPKTWPSEGAGRYLPGPFGTFRFENSSLPVPFLLTRRTSALDRAGPRGRTDVSLPLSVGRSHR